MTITIHAEVTQGDEEWHSLRRGILTASEVSKIITPTLKIADNEKTRQHVWEIAAQRITGYTEPTYIGDHMLRGHEDEIIARDLYSERYAPVQEVGFITNDALGFTVGYSPDGLVGDDGVIECKSRVQKYQVQTIVDMVPPDDFVLQLQTAFVVSGRDWLDFISYSGGLPMVTMRTEPDPKYQDAIKTAAIAFEEKVQFVVNKYRAQIEDAANRLIPTERRVEQEMFIGGEE